MLRLECSRSSCEATRPSGVLTPEALADVLHPAVAAAVLGWQVGTLQAQRGDPDSAPPEAEP